MSATTVPLGAIAEVQQGYTFKPKYQGHAVGEWAYVKVADIGSSANSKYIRQSLNYVSSDVLREMNATPFKAGSIVFPRVGAALRNNNKRILTQDSMTDDNVLVVSVKDQTICDPEYLFYWFDRHDLQAFCNSGTVPVINGTQLKRHLVSLPSLKAQQAVAKSLHDWDAAIETTERLVAAKQQRYVAVAERLIFDQSSLCHTVREFAVEIGERNRNSITRVLSVTNDRGFVLPEEQFERRVASDDLANYKVVRRGQYAYNPSRVNVGSIARLDAWADGVLSPMYIVFELDSSRVNTDYFLHWLASRQARQRIGNSTQGSVRDSVSFGDFAAISVPAPDLNRQAACANYLNVLLAEISLIRAHGKSLRRQKRGLMQKLLTGQWRLPVDEGVTA